MCRWQDNITMDLKSYAMEWTEIIRLKIRTRALVKTVINFQVP
jgi:hypothetical protein